MWGRRKVVVERAPVMSAEKLVAALAVPRDHPLLQALLAALAGMEEQEAELAGGPMSADERARVCGRLGALANAQEEIIGLVDHANRLKAGKDQ